MRCEDRGSRLRIFPLFMYAFMFFLLSTPSSRAIGGVDSYSPEAILAKLYSVQLWALKWN